MRTYAPGLNGGGVDDIADPPFLFFSTTRHTSATASIAAKKIGPNPNTKKSPINITAHIPIVIAFMPCTFI